MLLPGLWKIPNWRIRRLAAKGREQEAAAVAARYVRRRPSEVRGWVDLGDSLLHLKDFEGTAEAMERGLSRHPHEPQLTYLLATARVNQGRLDEAEALLSREWEESPEAFFPLIGRVKVARAREDWERALFIAEEAAERIPNEWAWGKFELATELMPIPAGRGLAERLLREAAAGLPPSQSRYALSHLLLGALIENTKPQEAQEHFREARAQWRSRGDLDGLLMAARDILSRDP